MELLKNKLNVCQKLLRRFKEKLFGSNLIVIAAVPENISTYKGSQVIFDYSLMTALEKAMVNVDAQRYYILSNGGQYLKYSTEYYWVFLKKLL